MTGEPSFGGDAFDSKGNPIPIEQIKNLEDLECYEDLHDGDFDNDDDNPQLRGLDGLDTAEMDRTAEREATAEKKGDEE